jgi:hypothetical protein
MAYSKHSKLAKVRAQLTRRYRRRWSLARADPDLPRLSQARRRPGPDRRRREVHEVLRLRGLQRRGPAGARPDPQAGAGARSHPRRRPGVATDALALRERRRAPRTARHGARAGRHGDRPPSTAPARARPAHHHRPRSHRLGQNPQLLPPSEYSCTTSISTDGLLSPLMKICGDPSGRSSAGAPAIMRRAISASDPPSKSCLTALSKAGTATMNLARSAGPARGPRPAETEDWEQRRQYEEFYSSGAEAIVVHLATPHHPLTRWSFRTSPPKHLRRRRRTP